MIVTDSLRPEALFVCRFLSISNFETAPLKKIFITSAHLAESDINSSSSIIVIFCFLGIYQKKGFNMFPEFHIITNDIWI